LEKVNAEIAKKGNEKIILRASKVATSTVVSLYAIFTKMAFVEKQMAPKRQMKIPPIK
jgi:hypothetical protein